ncbi:hypothetical protein [Paenibacillus sp. 481]|uniref:hypothetical protein n=1 Tax=Paenibacillus sp. 481 TaxID=2835869 RepID=UPI001E4C8BA9|nr:hypothetical protein [Paenibacillus sp. 481]UHA71911.1 hypothetical protein KIK04_14330 [Paenibacillus sp. 481]
MGKYVCKCGEVLSTHRVPNDVELIVYTDREWEKINCLESIDDMPEPEFDVWRCKQCERVYCFKGTELIKTYAIEY